jgi:hypothetical protein
MLGYMDNNMGYYQNRYLGRVHYVHPEVYTDGSVYEYVFSLVCRAFSKTGIV